ncbi:MAG: J domain-containing protein [Nitrosotalea sp.]
MLNNYSCYHLLNLQEGASMQEVKIAYRKLALRYHPDKNVSKQDGEKFKLIIEAYHTIKASQKNHTRVNYQIFYNKTSIDKLESIFHWQNPNQRKISKEEWHRHAWRTERTHHETHKHAEKVLKYSVKRLRNATSTLVHSVTTLHNQIPAILGSQVRDAISSKEYGIEIRLKNKAYLFRRLLHSMTMRAFNPCYLIHDYYSMQVMKLGKIKQIIKSKYEEKNSDIAYIQKALVIRVRQIYSWHQKSIKISHLQRLGRADRPRDVYMKLVLLPDRHTNCPVQILACMTTC